MDRLKSLQRQSELGKIQEIMSAAFEKYLEGRGFCLDELSDEEVLELIDQIDYDFQRNRSFD